MDTIYGISKSDKLKSVSLINGHHLWDNEERQTKKRFAHKCTPEWGNGRAPIMFLYPKIGFRVGGR